MSANAFSSCSLDVFSSIRVRETVRESSEPGISPSVRFPPPPLLKTSDCLVDLKEQLAVIKAEAHRWRTEARDLMNGLAVALDQQSNRWALSPAEKETALLFLKGLSHKEVASVRSVSDATARQQVRAVYKKAGLSGRHDLAAFFLEDLMLPAEAGDNRARDGA